MTKPRVKTTHGKPGPNKNLPAVTTPVRKVKQGLKAGGEVFTISVGVAQDQITIPVPKRYAHPGTPMAATRLRTR